MHIGTTLALVLAVLAVPASAQTTDLHWARSPVNGRWYGFPTTPMTWAAGETFAASRGGHLATIRSSAENDWLGASLATTPGNSPVWIGLNDIASEGNFVWSSGEPVTFTAWESGQPDSFTPEHDVVGATLLGTTTTRWRNIPTHFDGARPVIERSAIPTVGWRLPEHHALPFVNPGRPGLGDVDGDGRLDVVVPTRGESASEFAWLRGISGGFAPPQSVPTLPYASRVALGDFDLDGRSDVAVLGASPSGVRVHFAGALVDFAQTWSSPAYAGVSADVAAGDLDGDGRADVIAAFSGISGANRIVLFRADASGGFQTPIEFALGAGPREIALGDIDADGDLDWIVTLNGSMATVFRNDGTATSPVVATQPMPFSASVMTIADFDGDTHVDLGVTNGADATVRVLWGDGMGGFDLNGPAVLTLPLAMDLGHADFDGDGRPDLCGGSASLGIVSVALATGSGYFAPPSWLFAGNVPRGTLCGDLDGDGRPEIVTVANPSAGAPSAHVIVQRRFATDCDADGVDDASQIRDDTSLDRNHDGRLDACEIAGDPFCLGDGSGAPCPCGNASAPGAGEGCLHSFATGGRLVASGTASLAADNVTLLGSRMPDSSALFFQGTNEVGGGAGAVFGDGLRCAGGTVTRLGTQTNQGGLSQYPGPSDPSLAIRGGVLAPGTRTYQVWYRNSAVFCTPATFNLTNGVRIDWTL